MKRVNKISKTKDNMQIDRKWKEGNKRYLVELQNFFDKVDNIEDCDLRQSIRNQMLVCDKVLTEIAEKKFLDFYNEGYKKAKKG